MLRAPPAQSPWHEATRMWWVANRMGRRVLAVLGHRLDGPLSRESRKPLAQKRGAVNGSRFGFLLFGRSRMLQCRDKDPRKNEDYKRSLTRNPSALISFTNAFPLLLHSFPRMVFR